MTGSEKPALLIYPPIFCNGYKAVE